MASLPGQKSVGPSLPNSPLQLQVASVTTTTVSLTWSSPYSGGTAPPVLSYNLYQNGARVQSGLASTTTTATGLASSTLYTYAVTAVNANGEGLWSNAVQATTSSGSNAIVWRPGMRIFPGTGADGNRNWGTLAAASAAMDKVDAWDVNNIVKGFLFPVYWAQLEISQDVYDDPINHPESGFTKLQGLINKAASYNPPRDICLYINQTGNGLTNVTGTSFPTFFAPAYFNSSTYEGGVEWGGRAGNDATGVPWQGNASNPAYPNCNMTIWNANTLARLQALLSAYYGHFGPALNGSGLYLVDLFSEISLSARSFCTNAKLKTGWQTFMPNARSVSPRMMMTARLSFGSAGTAADLVSCAQIMFQNQICMGDEDMTNAVYNPSATLTQAQQNKYFAWGDEIYCGQFTNGGGFGLTDHRPLNDWALVGNVEIAEYGRPSAPTGAVPPAQKGSGYIYDNANFPGIMTGANFLGVSHIFWHVDEGLFGPNINNTTFSSGQPANPTPGPAAGQIVARPHLGDVITGNPAYAGSGVGSALVVPVTTYPSGWPT